MFRLTCKVNPMNHGMNAALAPSSAISKHSPGFSLVPDRARTIPNPVQAQVIPEGTVTLMFGGLEDLSEMTERLGDQAAYQLLKAYQSMVQSEIRRHGGFEVELTGDGFLFAFSAAHRAVRCAIAIERALAGWSEEHAGNTLRPRIGLHVGEPIKEGGRFFGKPVIVASRIATHARAGEIAVSSLLRDLVAGTGDLVFDAGHDVELKGLAGTQRVYGVLWDSAAPQRSEPIRRDEPPRDAVNCFRLDGDFWTIVFEGRTSRIRDAKGLRYIATLLRRPGEEIHVSDLASPSGDGTTVAAGETEITLGLGDAGEMIDGQARADYRRRLESLEEEIEEARRWNDVARREAREREKEFIIRELSSAYGLGGRARKASDATERARKAVTSRIRDSIGRIAEDHAALARHLELALRLGTFCRYEPQAPIGWAA